MPEESTTDVPILSRLRAPEGAVRGKKRKGRGPGTGIGKTSGKGMKGQKARSPGNFQMRGFEGGQTPIYRRLPKYGFKNPFTKKIVTLNVKDLNRFEANATVTLDTLREEGLIQGRFDGVKVLGNGELDKKLTVQVNAFSTSAKAKIEKAGGTAEVIEIPDRKYIRVKKNAEKSDKPIAKG